MSFDLNNTLGEWVAGNNGASSVFIKHDLDFCCDGAVPLKEACQTKSIDPHLLIKEIEGTSQNMSSSEWSFMGTGLIIDNILELFHKRHREDLKILIPMAQKVESVHANKLDCPKGLAHFLVHLSNELESHMQKEEQILFPMMKSDHHMMACEPINVMMHEHVEHCNNLQKLKSITYNFVPPAHACKTWQALYSGLAKLQKEIKEHIAIENNVLFPKFL